MKTRQIILYRKPTINTRSGARIRTRSIILACTSKYKYIRKRRLCAENGLPSSVLGLCQVCCMLYRGVPLYLLPLAAAAAAVVCSNAIIICASNIRSHRQWIVIFMCCALSMPPVWSYHVLSRITSYYGLRYSSNPSPHTKKACRQRPSWFSTAAAPHICVRVLGRARNFVFESIPRHYE